jgi:crotonobetainyl-CoA:carnitine CoA-transferase CaiB-like acyl-CoA transferase
LKNDAHLQAVGFFKSSDHPSEGKVRYLGVPSRWSGSQPGIHRDAPRLGQHSVEILRETGIPEAEIESLIASGACFAVQPAKKS